MTTRALENESKIDLWAQRQQMGENGEKRPRENQMKVYNVHIADKDCVALRVKYHKRCYERYTSFLRRRNVTDVADEIEIYDRYAWKYEKSFNVFLWKFVKEKLLINEGMKRIKAAFVKTVAEI